MTGYKIKEPALADQGSLKLRWAESRMPVLQHLRRLHRDSKPLAGMRIAGCLHVTKETAILIRALRDAGADVAWSGCNPLSTQDDVAAALAAEGVPIYAWHGLSTDEFYWCIDQTLAVDPTLTLDDGADLIFRAHAAGDGLTAGIIGGTEETTTGVHRLRAMADDHALKYPVIAVNDATTKWDFDNVYGTGQSALDGVLRATSVLLAGKQLVVAGFGHCGRGVAQRARGLGANVVVTEVDPIAALKATLEGFNVSTMDAASAVGDVFVTTTGIRDVITRRHFERMKDGAIVCNAGHYDCEINLNDLAELTVRSEEVRSNNREHVLGDGRRLYILAQGRLVNLAAAEGHPPEVMDMSFANQFLSLIRLAKEGSSLSPLVYPVPEEQDREIAAIKLQTMGIQTDELTAEQQAYRTDYAQGT
ncbi:MAG: adenosylhomocysteinase [Spirochaetaceae bacterium]|nr:adenosylhomocysteinase [Spirochaetaceae bacterium]